MKLPTIEQQQEIEEIIATRFNSSVDYAHVLRWLDNFSDEEQNFAISILPKIRYYKYEEILMILKDGIVKCAASKKNIIFLSAGDSGKSGDSILYSVQQILKTRGKYANNIVEALNLMKCSDDILILVDDILGSGTTLCKWLNTECEEKEYGVKLKQSIALKQVKFLCVVATQIGINKLNKYYPNIAVVGEITPKAFTHVGSVFGGSVYMKRYREFCYKYGSKLKPDEPLGFKNGQCLVVFCHSTPNNTLPIIWASNKVDGKQWFPLFPRSVSKRVDKALTNMQECRKQLFFLHNLFGYDYVVKELFSSTNIYILIMIKLLQRNLDNFEIAHILGVSQKMVDTLWQKGLEKHFWNTNHQLTDKCKKEFGDLNKKIMFQRTAERERKFLSSTSMMEEIIYVPETFKGVK